MSVSYRPEVPTVAEAVVVVLCAVQWSASFVDFGPGPDPLDTYNANIGITIIDSVALGLSGILTALFAVGRLRPSFWRHVGVVTIALASVAAALPWVEVWWGGQFYYGEVRDKQGLPLGTVFGGPIGTIVFLQYVALRTPIAGTGVPGRTGRAVVTMFGVILLQLLLTMTTRNLLRF